jgi:UDP-N-acetylglucosamine pyrophosphorylase
MAGRQGSRLKAPVPRAMLELDIPSHRTLLDLQLRQIRRLQMLYGSPRIEIPVYILMCDATHSAIGAFLLAHANFGFAEVKLIKQR